ncbi:MAG TPA: ABC transporter ATP-binding protein [Polyangiaceae bacterium]|nr:ABC transporter ATP-binding protein [Polyangiaceae bacterium]
MSSTSPWAVRLERVTKTYGSVRALVAVTADFASGEVTAVLGPNGSGKSTLLSLVGTLSRPTSGTVSHGELGATAATVRRSLGWVGHASLCYPDLTGAENLRLAAELYGCAPGEALREASERFDLGAFMSRPFREYSRGQRQRVSLARALVHGPRLLLLDEPTTGLDRSGVGRLTEVIRTEVARGATVVVVSHDEGFAAEVAGSRLRLERGRVVDRS